jgi:3-hydroxy acid dehydrogenase / malonic semialdehyde reductase
MVMSIHLKGKTILITGASSGIGRSTALEFARACSDDLKLIITARRRAQLEELAAAIKTAVGDGVKVLPFALDVSDRNAVRAFITSLPEEWKNIEVLVNNAGLARGLARAPDIRAEDMNLTIDTNIIGTINMTQAVLPRMLKNGQHGKGDIINIGSIAGRDPYPGGSVYCATKAAMKTFSDALRKELIATKIRVMQIDPGQVETEISYHRFYGDKARADQVYAGCESLTPKDIAEVIVFAASRRESVVFADAVVYPSCQAGAITIHKVLKNDKDQATN